MSKWMIAPECKTFIYELGEKGTNKWFCQVQSAGPEKASLKECGEVAALIADAPALLDALEKLVGNNSLNSMSRTSKPDLMGRVSGTWGEDAEMEARALIEKHRG